MARLHRRNFLPAFIVVVFLWICSSLWIVLVSPEWKITLNMFQKQFLFPIAVIIFLILLLLCLFFTFSLLLGNIRRGIFMAVYVLLILLFRLLKIGHWYNNAILTLILLVQEYYFIKKK